MRYLSVCSGIEAATVAWHGMGWKPVGFSEVEPFTSQVLAHHFPDVENYGDMTNFKEWDCGETDILVGGTPCQSFSVAGLRSGLDDPRGNLALVYCAMLEHFRPTWFVWENVPGVLSSNKGRDFGAFLGAVAKLGYGFAYRVLDAQYFGVAQRRRRVFVVGHLGDWRSAAAVLFERQSLCRDTPPSRDKGQETTRDAIPSIANCLTSRMHKGINTTVDEGQTPIVQVYENHPNDSRVKEMGDTCQTVTSRWGTGGGNTPIVAQSTVGALCARDYKGVSSQYVNEGKVIPLNTMAIQGRPSDKGRMGLGIGNEGEPCPTLTKAHSHAVATGMAVRKLTPIECERLQGFPDNYTQIAWRNKPADQCPDGHRYKALGNSMAVPVMRWIGQQIEQAEKL